MNAFTQHILFWYSENGRDLPWRRTRDPYAVWLSEIILQQTRIAQGTAYWHRFMERFPTVEQLADASEDEVLRLWEGLGYYSRARNLHAAAKQIVAAGGFPTTLEGIKALKGVGDYTAAAIGSICFGLPAAVVDGNVYRVLSRYFGLATPVGTTEAKKEFTAQYNDALWEQVQREATIHYTGGKPWNIFSVRFADWWRTYESLPEEIRQEWTPPRKAATLWKLYRIRPAGALLEGIRRLKQALKR